MPPAKILAVDDEPDFETLITQRFRREIRTQEFQFRFARHGEEALAALAAEPDIDLILLDINMPGIDRQRAAAERARANLARYSAPHLAALLPERDEPLGAVRRQTVAVLFTDIVGFTRMAENMAPEAVVTLLRQFHDRLTAQIFACGGSVEKYIGDEIFAVFGVPEPTGADAANALNCGRLMLDALAAWNRDRESASEARLMIGIGINYGPAVLGDVGSEQSLSFTVIGDTVNTASRLQGLTRTLQTPLVVADAAIRAIDAPPGSDAAAALASLQDRGEQALRGRTGEVRIWTWAGG